MLRQTDNCINMFLYETVSWYTFSQTNAETAPEGTLGQFNFLWGGVAGTHIRFPKCAETILKRIVRTEFQGGSLSSPITWTNKIINNSSWILCSLICFSYWAIQAGLLTPLTFARHRLSPLAAFTPGAYFLHTGRQWQRICEFYTANFKGIFWGP